MYERQPHQTHEDNHACRREPRRTQFTIKSLLVAVLVAALAVGWLADRLRLQARNRARLQAEVLRGDQAETRFNGFLRWYASENSLDDIPDEYRLVLPSSIDPKNGFCLTCVKQAHMTLSYAGLDGKSFRVRGGPFRYELLCEDLSGPEPSTVYRLTGPDGEQAEQNADGVFTYVRPSVFEYVNGKRQPNSQPYILTFAQGKHRPIKIPATDVWPEWVYASGDVKGVSGSEVETRSPEIPAEQSVELFMTELAASDGRRARLRLTVTCLPYRSKEPG